MHKLERFFKLFNFIKMLVYLLYQYYILIWLACSGLIFADIRNIWEGLYSNEDEKIIPMSESHPSINKEENIIEVLIDLITAKNCIDPPDSCPNENITFWLYTRSTQDRPALINVSNAESLKTLPYGKGNPWKLILHGYTGHKDFSPNSELRPVYFEKGDYNIISIDYNPLVKEPCYIQSVRNVPLIANCTALMIDRMVEEGIFKLEELHVIGFSLGGQVSGHLSRFLKSGTLKRITGLDPALPLFIGNALGKLDESDAEFVDVIHTDAGRKGKLERSGHVDFYPNGGYTQIGCNTNQNFTLSGCSHVRASYYFAESITTSVGFWGIPCTSYIGFIFGWCKAEESDLILMGEYTPPTARGTYYLNTNNNPPYALGKDQARKVHWKMRKRRGFEDSA